MATTRTLSSGLSTFGGDNPGCKSRVWAFLDHPLQGIDIARDFRPALKLSSCFSTECWDKSTRGLHASKGLDRHPAFSWIKSRKLIQKDDWALFDHPLQVLGRAGDFRSTPKLSSTFSTVGGDKYRAGVMPQGGDAGDAIAHAASFGRPLRCCWRRIGRSRPRRRSSQT